MNSKLSPKWLWLPSFGILCATSLLTMQGAFAQTSVQILRSNGQTLILSGSPQVSSSSSQIIQRTNGGMQRTSVSLNSTALRQPCWLTISTPTGQLSGQIKIGNKVIQSLKGNRTTVNLAPYLARGTKTIDITGRYQPKQAAVRIEFSGTGTKVSQQTSGSGIFNHSLAVTVR